MRTTNENDQLLWDGWLKDQIERIDFTKNEDELFEFVIAEKLLQDFDLSVEEIQRGIVDGGQDGGIDAFYVIANDILVEELDEIPSPGNSPRLTIRIIQSKNQANFAESPIEKISLTMDDILTFDQADNVDLTLYNEAIQDRIRLFQAAYQKFASKFPSVRIDIYYACRGSHPNRTMEQKAIRLEESCREKIRDAEVNFNFLGISDLLNLARKHHSEIAVLRCTEGPLLSSDGGLVALVKLEDYFKFVTTSDGNLRTEIFESNVRDYQGSTEINKEIRKSLIEPSEANFWWLNNGITVICRRLEANTKNLHLEGAQIVNGLQTSYELFRSLADLGKSPDGRLILVRVIDIVSESIRDEVIKATNSQTSIPPSSLRASEKIQRDIEDFFRPRGYYYDRRKNEHKNEGRPASRIVSIPRLAQAYSSVVLGQPDNARARPSSLLKSDDRYDQVFSQNTPLETYMNSVLILGRVDEFIRMNDDFHSQTDRNNAQFHIAMAVAQLACGTVRIYPQLVKDLDVKSIPENIFQMALDVWKVEFEKERQSGTPSDVIAKGPQLVAAMRSRITELLAGNQ